MPSIPMSNEDIANVLTFVYNSFGNSGMGVTPDEVNAFRGMKEVGNVVTEMKKANAPSEPSLWE